MSASGSAGLIIGSTLGNYRVMSLLGRGGMGAVYEGEHAILGRKAAIKVLLPEYSHNADLVDRFFKEARATARLRHRSFVEVFDSGTLPDGSAYLVMEMLEGESLGGYLARRGMLPLGEALTIAQHIAEGVGQAHRAGIVHRDLKPDNVFLARGTDPERPSAVAVKILDFGIAKLGGMGEESASRTRTGTLMGTPLFMAPEQCRGAGRVVIDHRADIYALGCILHAMISGQPPFPLEGLGEIIAAHLSQQPPPLRSLLPNVPEPIESFVLALLSKAVEARPSSMDLVGQELRRLGGMPGMRSVDLASLPVAQAPPEGNNLPTPMAPRVKTRPSHPSLRQGGTEQMPAVKTFSTLTAAAGAQSVAPAASSKPRGKAVMLVAVAGVVLVGGYFGYSALFDQPPPRRDRHHDIAATTAPPDPVTPVRRPPPVEPKTPDPEPPVEAPPLRPVVAQPRHDAPPEPIQAARSDRSESGGEVRVRISSSPSGADVIDAQTGARVGETPFDTMVPSKRKLARYTLRKGGYHSRDLKVKLDSNVSLDIVLGKKSAPAGGGGTPAAPPDDNEDERRKL